MIKRYDVLVLAAAFWIASLCGVARANPMGALVGTVAGLTGTSIDVKANRQIVHILLPSPFFAVYLADQKTRAALTDISIGMTVRIAYSQSAAGAEQKTAREIDILSNY